jgi:SAM-dependent MidA family methyltransferase
MWILREIEACGGEVDFRRFMELALYHPRHGYYTSAEMPWGKQGDFLTAPTVSGWYGAVLAGLLSRVSGRVGEAFELVDLAAGDGSFLGSLTAALEGRSRRVLTRTLAIERSRLRRRQIAARFDAADIEIPTSDAMPESMAGPVVVHASELYDAMPVHRVSATAAGLVELVVGVAGDRLEWRERRAPAVLEDYLCRHGVELDDGQIAEINLEAEPFHRGLLSRIGEGLVLVLDYGYPAARLYDPRGRRRGSLATFHKHELGTDPLSSPGERDITAHVNFDDLRSAAAACGFSEIGFMPLAEFLVRAGLGEILEARGLGMEAELDADTVSARQEIKQLLDPEGMGSDLKMLVQGKGRLGEIAAEILGREL